MKTRVRLLVLAAFVLAGLSGWAQVCSAAALEAQPAAETSPAKAKGADAEKEPADEPAKEKAKPKVTVDEKQKAVTVPAVVAELPEDPNQPKPVRYLLVGKGGKAGESVFVTECDATEIMAAPEKIGLKVGEPATEKAPPKGTPVGMLVEYELKNEKVRRAADEFVAHVKTGEMLKGALWPYTGSTLVKDPETKKEVRQAALTGGIVGLYWTDRSPLVQNPRPEARTASLYKANAQQLPPAGTQVRITLKSAAASVAEGTRRVHVFVSGRVQGVGFRAFTTRSARQLGGLTGWVRNLRDGRVEAVVEGPKDKVAELLKLVEKGPQRARVDKVEVSDELPRGEFKTFEQRR